MTGKNKQKSQKEIFGLLLTGGKSRRMNKDKGALVYGDQAQTRRAFKLLEKFCEKVFVSTRSEQSGLEYQKDLPQVHDHSRFEGNGPLSGILSAMSEYPDVPWLILACDLPFVNEETLEYLLDHRDPEQYATAYLSARDGLPEPLCAVYEPSYRLRLEAFLSDKNIKCPRKIMINSDVNLIRQKSPRWLDNVNTPEDYEKAVGALGKRGKNTYGKS